MKPRVVYWNNIPSPYFVERFNTLVARGNLEFEGWFNEERRPDRSWDVREADWQFAARYIEPRAVMGRRLHVPMAELRAARPDLLVSLYASGSFACGIAVARALGVRTAIRVLPTFDSWFRRSRQKEAAKRLLFGAVDGAKVPGPAGEAVARKYGVPRDRITHVTQSVQMERYAAARRMEASVREAQRREIGLRGCVFIYVGRIWRAKGLDTLLDAFERVQALAPEATLLIVGDGVDEEMYRERARQLEQVLFAGFAQAPEVARLYALADVAVFPTLGDPHGLVVEEAMASGLPVISSAAAGDIERRLPDGEAGFVVPAADVDALTLRMTALASDAGARQRMGERAALLAAQRSHEAWAADFEGFVARVLSLPRRRTVRGHAASVVGRALLAGWGHSTPAPRIGGAHVGAEQ